MYRNKEHFIRTHNWSRASKILYLLDKIRGGSDREQIRDTGLEEQIFTKTGSERIWHFYLRVKDDIGWKY